MGKILKQLCIYAYILKIKHQKALKRLYIYWISENDTEKYSI